MTDIDRQVAEKVMGWTLIDIDDGDDKVIYCPSVLGKECEGIHLEFNPTTNASDDYEVLKHIRENWIFSKRQKFIKALQFIILSNKSSKYREFFMPGFDVILFYEPGDYSHAAIISMTDITP